MNREQKKWAEDAIAQMKKEFRAELKELHAELKKDFSEQTKLALDDAKEQAEGRLEEHMAALVADLTEGLSDDD